VRPTRTALLLALALAACDDGTVITHVFRLPSISERDLVAMQRGGGIPTEIHGTPFLGAPADALAAALEGPAGAAQVRFRTIPVGSDEPGHGPRLVLHFNPLAPPNGPRDCRRTGPAETGPPEPEGFRVAATFCQGTEMQAHGYLEARRVPEGNYEEYTRVMRALFLNIFREEPER
jgi:hypothetical protein